MITRKDARLGETDLYPNDADPGLATVIARASDRTSAATKNEEDKIHVFWRVFGGAILSVTALTAVTLYNSLQSNVAEIRGELVKINEVRADLVRKDEFNARISASYDRFGMIQAQNTAQTATVVSLKSDLDSLKEKLAQLTADSKVIGEDVLKNRAELEKNVVTENERKLRRDEQMKEYEKSLKDLQAALQACQVKLARLEGQQHITPPKPQDMP